MAVRPSRNVVIGTASVLLVVVLAIVVVAALNGGERDDTSSGTSTTDPVAPTSPAGSLGDEDVETAVTSEPDPSGASDPSQLGSSSSAPPPPATGGADPTTAPTTPAATQPVSPPAAWTVVSVVSGDTLELAGPGGEWTVRLLGIEAPSGDDCYAAEAIDELRSLTDGPLVLVRDGPDLDESGRRLRYVQADDGVDVGAEMVLRGAARAVVTSFESAQGIAYGQREVQAQNEQVGMWAPDRCPQEVG